MQRLLLSAAPGWSHREPVPLGALEERWARLEAAQGGCRPAELWACRAHACGGRTPHRAALLPRLCEHDGCHGYSKLISRNCAGRPCLLTVCSWVTAHIYFSRVSNGNKWMPLWLDTMFKGARVSVWSASHCHGANQGSDGYSDYLPQNIQLHLSKNSLAQLTGFTNLKFLAWLLKNR